MAQGVSFPNVNSEQFVPYGQTLPSIYHTEQFNTNLFQKSIPRFQRYNAFWNSRCPQYFQIKQLNDSLNFVLDTLPYTTFSVRWVRFDGTSFGYSGTVTTFDTTGNVYTADGSIPPIQLTTIQCNLNTISTDLGTTAGKYFLEILVTGTDAIERTFISEPYNIKANWENSVLVQYADSQNQYDVAFDRSPNFSLRIPAFLDYLKNNIEFSKFRDQQANLRQTYARDWRIFQLTVGSTIAPYGITPYHCDKLAKILKCDQIYLDGKRFILEDGAEFEPTMYNENYPMRTLVLQFAEYYARNSDQFFGVETLILFELGATTKFPYLIKDLTFTKIYGTGATSVNFNADYAGGMREIFSGADETAYATELNTKAVDNGISAGFALSGGFMKFTNGNIESYSANVDEYRQAFIIEGTVTSPSKTIGIDIVPVFDTQLVRSAWRTVAGVPNTLVYAPTYTDYLTTTLDITLSTVSSNPYKIFMYHKDKLMDLLIEGVVSTSLITKYSGDVPESLRYFQSDYTNTPTLDLAFLRRAAKNIQSWNIRRGLIATFAAGSFDVLEVGDWQNVAYFGFSINAMTATNQDSVYNDIYAQIFSALYGTTFAIDTRVQSASAAPTGASLTARNNMTSAGNTMLF